MDTLGDSEGDPIALREFDLLEDKLTLGFTGENIFAGICNNNTGIIINQDVDIEQMPK